MQEVRRYPPIAYIHLKNISPTAMNLREQSCSKIADEKQNVRETSVVLRERCLSFHQSAPIDMESDFILNVKMPKTMNSASFDANLPFLCPGFVTELPPIAQSLLSSTGQLLSPRHRVDHRLVINDIPVSVSVDTVSTWSPFFPTVKELQTQCLKSLQCRRPLLLWRGQNGLTPLSRPVS